MTNLNTHIPLEDVKKSKKLQAIECRDYWYQKESDESLKAMNEGDNAYYYEGAIFYDCLNIKAPTIADIINNAEVLFGECFRFVMNYDVKEIIIMCQQDQSIKEITKYIINKIV